MMYAMTAAGLVFLFLAGEALVRGSVGLARSLGIPPLLIGLTIVAFGTSAPELFVSINAALSGAPGLSVGNIVGSNIANVWLVLGASALLAATPTDQDGLNRNVLMMLVATGAFVFFCMRGTLDFFAGQVLFGMLIVFLAYSGYEALKSRANTDKAEDALEDLAPETSPIWLDSIWLLVGIIGLPIGAHLIVVGGTAIAATYGVSDALIGLTIVAIGTSLPELATTIMAAWRRHTDVAVGNVVGSNIFNYLAIGGTTALVVPVPVPEEFLRIDLWVMAFACLMILPYSMRKGTLAWRSGLLFMMAYIGYIAFAVLKQTSL